MSKPSIDEQIEAAEFALSTLSQSADRDAALAAAIVTLKWAKKHAPTIKTVLSEFPGSRVAVREDE